MSSGKLLAELQENQKKIFFQFGGQGAPYFKEMAKLYKEPGLKKFFETSLKAVQEFQAKIGEDPLFDQGMDVKSWLENPEKVPDDVYLARGSVSITTIFITQAANFLLFNQKGYPLSSLQELAAGTTGHSQGILAAYLTSLAKEGDEYYTALEKFVWFSCYLGYRAQQNYTTLQLPQDIIQQCEELGDKNPAPMVACLGYNREELESRVNFFNDEFGKTDEEKIYVSLYNAPTAMIISGQPRQLIKFRAKYKNEMDEKKYKFVFLRTTAPFHCPLCTKTFDTFKADLKNNLDFPYGAGDIKIPLYSFVDGRNFQEESGNINEIMFDEIVIQNLHWNKALTRALQPDVGIILDFGPSKTIAGITSTHVSGANLPTKVYSVSNPKDLKTIY